MDALPKDTFVNILIFVDFPVFNTLSHLCKKEHYLYKFNKAYSIEYYQGKILKPPRRISINLSGKKEIRSLVSIKDVEEVNLEGCDNIVDMSPIKKCRKITFML